MKNKPKSSITLRVLKGAKVVSEVISTKYRRILDKIQRAEQQDCTFYICVRSGKHIDNFGKLTQFKNEGFYPTKSELLRALQIFYETS